MIFMFPVHRGVFLLLFIIQETASNHHELSPPSLSTFNISLPIGHTPGTCDYCELGRTAVSTYEDIDSTYSQSYIFKDPLPLGYLLKRVLVELVGAFHTTLSTDSAAFSVFIGSTVLQKGAVINDDFTTCHNCHVKKIVPSDYDPGYGWWPGYIYGGQNKLNVEVLQYSISLSTGFLSFQSLNVNPYLERVSPVNLSSTNLGKITLEAQNIFPFTFSYYCVTQGALNLTFFAVLNEGPNPTLSCTLPTPQTSPSPGSAMILWLIPDVFAWTTGSTFQFQKGATGPMKISFYKEPQIHSIIPSSGNLAGGTVISVYGLDFLETSSLSCCFGEDPADIVSGQWVSHQLINCVSPPARDNAVKVFVKVSQNGQSWIYNDSVMYSYTAPPRPPIPPSPSSHANLNTWIIVSGSVACGLFMIGVAYTVWNKWRKKSIYEFIPDFDATAVICISELDIKERIGRGSFGDVYRAYWRYSEVAVKKIPDPSDQVVHELYDEARIMLNLRHPNIVTFMACTLAKPDICIVTEYVSRGSLYKILHNNRVVIELDHVRKMALDACKGMAYLHAAHVIHRDLKSHNLLVDKSWTIKVADFGLSRAIEEPGAQSTLTACGTPCWTAPEVLRSQHYSFFADVYSFGICLWEMVTRCDPFYGLPAYQVVISVATQNQRPAIPKKCHPEFLSLITQCWDEVPENRPTFGRLTEVFSSMTLPKARPIPTILSCSPLKKSKKCKFLSDNPLPNSAIH